jgi:adenine-specific DNA-methyltransferase
MEFGCMKYMGHKGKLLPLLGDILLKESVGAKKIADPFCGSGAVSWFLAESTSKSVVSGDLQSFAVARAAAVIERTEIANANDLLKRWFSKAKRIVEQVASQFPNADRSLVPTPGCAEKIRLSVIRSRRFCEKVLPPLLNEVPGSFPMSLAYGGHYFSPMQALELDALRLTLPRNGPAGKIGMAALIEAASRCAASPGHTAQPFQPTETSAKYIMEAWSRDVWKTVEQAVRAIAGKHAKKRGLGITADFSSCIEQLSPGDLVFADPPYSDVHYSRFYHVLETLCRGSEIEVFGVGRYPPVLERPASSFSRKTEAMAAASALINQCAGRELRLVLTFPTSGASNGLNALDFIDLAKNGFRDIEVREVDSVFSTLGGSAGSRGGRKNCAESIICFRP